MKKHIFLVLLLASTVNLQAVREKREKKPPLKRTPSAPELMEYARNVIEKEREDRGRQRNTTSPNYVHNRAAFFTLLGKLPKNLQQLVKKENVFRELPVLYPWQNSDGSEKKKKKKRAQSTLPIITEEGRPTSPSSLDHPGSAPKMPSVRIGFSPSTQ